MQSIADGQPLAEILTSRQKWLLIFSLMIAMFIGAIDQTVVATATPRILADLGGFDLLSWLFTSYMLASTVVVPLVGKLSDIFGRKAFVLAGIVLFLLSSAACGAAPTMVSLIIFRAVQGVGGGMIFASVFATVGDVFSPAERGKYVGMFTGVFGLASILGPTVGGFLTDNGGWRWVFYINIPFSLVALPAIWFNLPSRHGANRPRIDFLGAALLSVASVLLLLSFEWIGNHEYAWDSAPVLSCIVVAVLALVAFVYQEARHPEAIIPLHLFRNRTFVLSNVIVFIVGIGMFGALQYLSLFVQIGLGASATASGLITTPQSAGMLVASILGGQLIARTGRYRVQSVLGSIIVLGCMLFLRTVEIDMVKWHISAAMVVLGFGVGLVMPTMALVVQNAVPYRYLGVASSSNQFFRQIGGVFGVAIFAAVLTSSYESAFSDQLAPSVRDSLGPEVVTSFEDPTLPLNPTEYRAVTAAVSGREGGKETLAAANQAQRESVAIAVRDIFTGSAIVAGLGIVLCAFLKEVPTERRLRPAAEGEAAAAEQPPPALVVD